MAEAIGCLFCDEDEDGGGGRVEEDGLVLLLLSVVSLLSELVFSPDR